MSRRLAFATCITCPCYHLLFSWNLCRFIGGMNPFSNPRPKRVDEFHVERDPRQSQDSKSQGNAGRHVVLQTWWAPSFTQSFGAANSTPQQPTHKHTHRHTHTKKQHNKQTNPNCSELQRLSLGNDASWLAAPPPSTIKLYTSSTKATREMPQFRQSALKAQDNNQSNSFLLPSRSHLLVV